MSGKTPKPGQWVKDVIAAYGRLAAQKDSLEKDIEAAYRAVAALPQGPERRQLRARLDKELGEAGISPRPPKVPRTQSYTYLMEEAGKARKMADAIDRGGDPKRAASFRAAAKKTEAQAWRALDAPDKP
jgi:hypothetical protein